MRARTLHLAAPRMYCAGFSTEGLSPSQPPAVVIGDLTLIRPHGMAGIPVIVATREPRDVALRSRYVRGACVLPAEPRLAVRALLELGDRLHRALGRRVPLVYGSDRDLDLLYRHREALSQRYLFVLNEPDLCWSLLDKERFSRLCAEEGVRAPRTLGGGEDLSGLDALREPLLVKPRRKSGGKAAFKELLGAEAKARVFATRRELTEHPAFARLRGELVIQEYIDARATDLCSFHGFADEEGRLLASFCGRKLRTYPAFAGESSLVEVSLDEEVDAAGREIAERLGLRGPFKIDLARDAGSGELHALEVNARYTLWHYLGAAAGVNLPVVAYDLLVHGRRPEAPPRPSRPRRWLNLYRDWLAFREQRGDELTLAAWLRSVARPGAVYEAFAWEDPEPFAWWAGGMVRHALRDRVGHSR